MEAGSLLTNCPKNFRLAGSKWTPHEAMIHITVLLEDGSLPSVLRRLGGGDMQLFSQTGCHISALTLWCQGLSSHTQHCLGGFWGCF